MNLSDCRIALCVTNDLSGDQRMHRIASTLQSAGCQVGLIGRRLPDSRPLAARPYRCRRLSLPFTQGKLFYLSYNLYLLRHLLDEPVDVIVANDLDTLLACYLASRWKGCVLVYDSHEYFTEVPELIGRWLTRRVWLTLERWLLPKLAWAYTVNDSLARLYRDRYGVPMQVIRNVPFPRPRALQLRADRLLIYQGAVNLGRGVELMVAAMRHLPGYTLWVVGRGDVWTEVAALVDRWRLADRVKLWGFVAPQALAQLTPQASLGLSLEEDLGANYHYASPNKVYDYIQARTPVLVSDLPEMAKLVTDFGVGAVLPREQRRPEQLAAWIDRMHQGRDQYEQWVAACEQAAQVLHWDQERERLLEIYRAAVDRA
jgi:glycosyltransferase involved in cell wall biosynthesis